MEGQCTGSARAVQGQCRASAGPVHGQCSASAGPVQGQCRASTVPVPRQCRTSAGPVQGRRFGWDPNEVMLRLLHPPGNPSGPGSPAPNPSPSAALFPEIRQLPRELGSPLHPVCRVTPPPPALPSVGWIPSLPSVYLNNSPLWYEDRRERTARLEIQFAPRNDQSNAHPLKTQFAETFSSK